ncbi:two-component system sensor histidine kinase SapS [Enterococcus canintestini]|uniref:two-component system sensor histidine kinase SapS n=1 Tax=Enterococcus canintestini TaxID=317010 RepID=UPI002892229C|nr:sensor histidine kinase [Enterococcus canintestini]MDT2740169.1 sensor histidine kinase [Enterococcus canintestini]
MNFLKYLKDQWLLVFGWVGFVFLTAFVMWLTPGFQMSWRNVGYLALIEGVFFAVILIYHYYYKRRWWQKLQSAEEESPIQNYLTGARTYEEQVQQDFINQIIREHQVHMQKIIAAQEEQKDYIDSWVHEIKVPLAASRLLLHAVEFDISDEKYMQLENELGKIDGYVEQVLYVARLDNFSKDYLIEETKLKSVIQPIMRSNANYFIQKKLRYQVIGENHSVLTDAKWIGFIFQQLLSNAIKYTPENGEIFILLDKSDKGVTLTVKDSGIGIPKEDLRRIFDKGFTGQNGRFSEMHATGLGLYLAQNLASQLGVELTAESTVGVGTAMTLFFPYVSYYQEQR